MNVKIKILIVDDHTIVRIGLTALLGAEKVPQEKVLVIYDRAIFDDRAYISQEEFEAVLSRNISLNCYINAVSIYYYICDFWSCYSVPSCSLWLNIS